MALYPGKMGGKTEERTEVCKPVILVIPDAPCGLRQLLLSAHMHAQRLQIEVASAGRLPVSMVILTKHDV